MGRQNDKFYPGSRRANEQLRETVANILLFDVADPLLSMVTITGADVSPDKRNAKLYYTANKQDYDDVQSALNKASGYIKKLAGDRLGWRVVPQITYHLDLTVDAGESLAYVFNGNNN